MWLAYNNTKFILKHEISVKRKNAVTRDMSEALAEDKRMSKKEKDETILRKRNEDTLRSNNFFIILQQRSFLRDYQ